MTLMLILGAVAACYCLLLLFRCATYALPVFAGLGLVFTLRDHGFGWSVIVVAGLLAGISLHALGRHLTRSSAPLAVRLGVILMFVGAAAAAGFQAGAALSALADLDPFTQRSLSILIGLVTGHASWRDLRSLERGIEPPALHG
ncbi:hypothetical protein [Sphingopyxis sp.]|uniref:hypothetical protein n=1 Tax=Sphingopyxis sp. TaxID=1908224 RepID=UPI002D769992|nr:hypothetical protein [Sphingopyxis sp.]HET6523160.1 hypothetical protein [Sphingopyxis sp.]